MSPELTSSPRSATTPPAMAKPAEKGPEKAAETAVEKPVEKAVEKPAVVAAAAPTSAPSPASARVPSLPPGPASAPVPAPAVQPIKEQPGREIAPGIRELVFADGSVYKGGMKGVLQHGQVDW